MRGGRGPTALLIVLAIEVGVAAFVVLLGTTAVHLAPVRVLAHLALGVPLLVWWLGFGIRQALPLMPPIAIVLAAYAVVSLFGQAPRAGLETLAIPACLVAAYGAAYLTADHVRIRGAASLAVGLAATVWLTAIAGRWVWEKAEWVLLGGGVPPLDPLHHYVWLVGNAVPMLALVSLPFVANLRPGVARAIVSRIFGAAALLVIVLSGGAIALAGIVVALALFIALRRPRWRSAGMVVAGTVTGALVAVPLLSPLVHELLPGALAARAVLWQQTMQVFADHSMLGSGPATFAVERLRYVEPFASPVVASQGHSMVLQLLAEGGILLGAACVGLAAALIGRVRSVSARLRDWHHLVIACIGGLAATAVAESFHELMAPWFLCAILIGWLLRDVTEPAASVPHRAMARWTVIAATVLSVPFVILADGARIASHAGGSAWAEGEHADAARSYEAAVAMEPSNPAHHLALGLVRAEEGDRDGSREAYRRALAMNPYDARASGGLAGVTDDVDTRIDLLAQSAARTESDPQYAWRWAHELESVGRHDEAVEAYALAIMLEPLWLAEVRETGPASRGAVAEVVPGILEQFGHAARVDVARVELDVSLVMDAVPTDAPPAWRAVDERRHGGERQAISLAREAVATAPLDARSWQALAAVLPCSSPDRAEALSLEERTLNSFRRVSAAVLRNGERYYATVPLGDYQPSSAETPRFRMWPAPVVERCSSMP